MVGLVKSKRQPLYCSFCGKERDEVGYLIAGPTVFICNECVELCREIGQDAIDLSPAMTSEEAKDHLRRLTDKPKT